MAEVSEIRKRLRHTIARAREGAAERRRLGERAEEEYRGFLSAMAIPVFRALAMALTSEGYPFKVYTPAGGVRLASEHNAADFIEMWLEPSSRQSSATVFARINQGRGQRVETIEKAVREGASPGELSESYLVEFLLREIERFVER